MYTSVFRWFLLILNFKFIQSHGCYSFENVLVELKDKTDNVYNKTVNGCIERTEFDNRNVTEAYITNQKISKLGRDSVRNMKYLRTILFSRCDLEIVEPISFRNVPNLKDFEISFCNIKNISEGIFSEMPKVQIVKIHHNKINFIQGQALANLNSLRKIYVSHNYLDNWSSDWFYNSTNLETMDFQYNKIREIPKLAFASLSKLKLINFDHNALETIQPEAFQGLTDLNYLGLKHNKLKEINVNVFPNKLRIKSAIFSANYLNFLSQDLLKQISVDNIILDFNPWKCSCLDLIHFWINSNNGILLKKKHCDDVDVPVCAIPRNDPSICSENIDNELTERYLNTLRNISHKMGIGCAKID